MRQLTKVIDIILSSKFKELHIILTGMFIIQFDFLLPLRTTLIKRNLMSLIPYIKRLLTDVPFIKY